MLVLTRKNGEGIVIDNDIKITIIQSEDGKVKIGIDAPREVIVHRKEVFDRVKEENIEAAGKKNHLDSLSSLFKEHLK